MTSPITATQMQALTDTDLEALRVQVYQEQVRRATIADAPSQITGLQARFLTARDGGAGTIADPTPYVTPQGYQDAYPQGFAVSYSGSIYTAARDGAIGEPDTTPADWTLYTPPGEVTAWVQPHAGQEYPVGAEVTYNGHLWRNDLGSPNGFVPGATGSGWTDLGPTP